VKRSQLFVPHAQRNVFRRGDAHQQSRLFAARIHRRDAASTPTGFAEIISDDFTITSRPEGAMLGLDFAPANSALGGSESGTCSWVTVTQTEQNREYSASPFFYGNGETKFRENGDFCSMRRTLLIVQDRLRCGIAQFKLCAHLLQPNSECFKLRYYGRAR